MDIIIHKWGSDRFSVESFFCGPQVTLEEIGLVRNTRTPKYAHYVVVDKPLFMLAVMKYGIEWVEDKETPKKF